MACAVSTGALSGIHVSIHASLIATPSPSKIAPLTTIFVALLSTLAVMSTAQRQASCGNGPMVCEVVILLVIVVPDSLDTHRGGVASAQHDVELVAEHLVVDGFIQAEARDQTLACSLVRNALENRVVFKQRIAGEIHLRHQALRIHVAEHREVDVRRTPCLVMVAPRIRARLDRDETIAAV